ncbi:MAG: hypothetical protein IJ848_04225 [Alphaproteobacteria bacterium]|nr:hypothetical protein [Alphaproteobacteria bacterium]
MFKKLLLIVLVSCTYNISASTILQNEKYSDTCNNIEKIISLDKDQNFKKTIEACCNNKDLLNNLLNKIDNNNSIPHDLKVTAYLVLMNYCTKINNNESVVKYISFRMNELVDNISN